MESIKNRKSVFPKHFINKEISKETLLSILKSAEYAPTHRISEPWRFVVFHSAEAKEKLAQFMQSDYKANTSNEDFNALKYQMKSEKVLQSGAVFAIIMEDKGLVPQWEEVAATAMAVQNIWLSLDEYNLGGYWSSPRSAIENARSILNLKENEECMGFFYLGYYTAHERNRKRTPIQEKVSWM